MARGGGGGVRRWHDGGAVARGGRDGATAQLQTNTTPRNGCDRTIADATVTWLRVWWWRRATGLEDGRAGRPRGRRFVGRDGRGGGHGSAESQRRRRWRRLFQPPLRATAVRARITSHHRYIGRMASTSSRRERSRRCARAAHPHALSVCCLLLSREEPAAHVRGRGTRAGGWFVAAGAPEGWVV